MALSTMTNRSPGDSITAADWDVVRNNILLITGILITTNYIQVISYYILTTFPFLAKFG